jgi:hypothetical protein
MKLTFPFDSALRGIGGSYEITRVLGGFGCLAYCVCANAFVGWEVIINGKDFDITAYCLTFPGGLAAIIATAAGSAAVKDRQVAKSRVIQDTGAVPTKAPDGPQVPDLSDQHKIEGEG